VGGPADTYIKAADAVRAAQNHVYIDDIIKDLSSADESPAELNDVLTGDNLADALSIPRSNASELDINKDGKIDQDDAAGIKGKISANLPSLDKVAAGEKPTSNLNSFKLTTGRSDNPEIQTVFESLQPALRDGEFSQADIDAFNKLPLSDDTLRDLINKNWDKVKGGDQVQKALVARLQASIAAQPFPFKQPEEIYIVGRPNTGGSAPARDLGSDIARGAKRLFGKGRL
jgi:hypothetical protein